MNWTSILFAILTVVGVLVVMYIDSHLFDIHRTTMDYLKVMLWTGVIVYVVREWLPVTISAVENSGGIEFLHDLGEEMYSGKPTF